MLWFTISATLCQSLMAQAIQKAKEKGLDPGLADGLPLWVMLDLHESTVTISQSFLARHNCHHQTPNIWIPYTKHNQKSVYLIQMYHNCFLGSNMVIICIPNITMNSGQAELDCFAMWTARGKRWQPHGSSWSVPRSPGVSFMGSAGVFWAMLSYEQLIFDQG